MRITYLIFLLSVSLFTTASANNCTKAEIMKMIDRGFTKQDIDGVCKVALQETNCCCELKLYQDTGGMFKSDYTYQSSTYKWMNADSCSGSSENIWSERTVKQCSTAARCGR